MRNFNKMGSHVLTTDSGLIAIALVIRSRDGPRFVFHHPPRPTTQASQREVRYGTELDQSEIDEKSDVNNGSSGDSDLEDGGYRIRQSVNRIGLNEKSSKRKARQVEPLDGDDHYDSANGEQIVPWEHLGEFSTKDLENILTPSRAFHKKKFELSLDPLYFVSYPIHVREDGLWRKKKQKKSKKLAKEELEPMAGSGELKPTESEQKRQHQQATIDDNNSEDEDSHGGMTMFNVVFVLNIPKDEEDYRLFEIYEHVIKKFNKAAKHAQAQSNYVWKESEMILSMKEKAREERRMPFTSYN
jgi:hypothetical protein